MTYSTIKPFQCTFVINTISHFMRRYNLPVVKEAPPLPPPPPPLGQTIVLNILLPPPTCSTDTGTMMIDGILTQLPLNI